MSAIVPHESELYVRADLGHVWDILSDCEVPPSLEVFQQGWRDTLAESPGTTAETVARRVKASYVRIPQKWDK